MQQVIDPTKAIGSEHNLLMGFYIFSMPVHMLGETIVKL